MGLTIMADGRAVKESVAFVRGELRRIIEAETSSFRAGLFHEELRKLDTFERAVAERSSRFARAGLAAVLETVARYTLDRIEGWPESDVLTVLDGNRTCQRIARVFEAARRLRTW